jgi:hypothetical protein
MHEASVMDCWCRLSHTEKQLSECAESFREGAMNEYALAHALAFVGKLRLATFRLQLNSPSGLVVTPSSHSPGDFLMMKPLFYD